MKQNMDTAYLYGLFDLGTLEPGKKADHPERRGHAEPGHPHARDGARVHDLPTGKARGNQRVTGYELTMVSGVVTFEDGTHTGATPRGAVIREHGHRRAQSSGVLPGPPLGLPPVAWGVRARQIRKKKKPTGTAQKRLLAQSLTTEGGISNQTRTPWRRRPAPPSRSPSLDCRVIASSAKKLILYPIIVFENAHADVGPAGRGAMAIAPMVDRPILRPCARRPHQVAGGRLGRPTM
jgi:hypothetical protein